MKTSRAAFLICEQPLECGRSTAILLAFFLVLPVNCVFGQEAGNESPANVNELNKLADTKTEPAAQDDKLYFTFASSKWSDVIEWLASTADLALHVDELPKGTFTYNDSKGFTLQEAIDRINLFLLPEGFTLVRSGRLLSVINLGDPKSIKQLDTLARLVTVDQLGDLEDYDMVKCLFPLGELEATEAVEELSALNLLKTPDVFSRTNQLLITDTVAKLKLARQILTAFEPDALDNGTVVKSFPLKHVLAEDVLAVARPHLGLATGEMIGIDVSISADLLGKNIFVTGVEDKVKLIEGLIREIDLPDEKKTGSSADILQSHRVGGGNVEMVYNVLQTLLSGEEIRLSMDQASQSIVALAPAEIQKEISDTVKQLEASDAEFEVVPLKHADPYFVISLLEEMLDLESSSLDSFSVGTRDSESRWRSRGDWRGWNGGMYGQNNSKSIAPPKIDADPGGRKLFVRGTREQIEQIKTIVKELDVPKDSLVGSDSNLRIFPLGGQKAIRAIETAARFWQGENSIIFYPPVEGIKPTVKERVIADAPEQTKDDIDEKPPVQSLGSGRILTKKLNTKESPIQIQLSDRGLLLQSEDTQALDKFEQILQTVVGPADSVAAAPIIYYLKYAKPSEAIRMLAELLDGGDSAKDSESSTLVNGLVLDSSDSFFGSFVSTRDGTMTLTYGSSTVIADSRLNRLIAQGTVAELELIESYLKIIDKDRSITSIEIYGSSNIIELKNVDANEVADTLRAAFYGRVLGGTGNQPRPQQQPKGGNPAQPNRDPRQAQDAQARDGKDRGQANTANKGAPPQRKGGNSGVVDGTPKMTIAVHEPSNSLIITAPEPLFKQAEKLAKLIDSRSVQAIEILQVSRPLATDLREVLNGETPSTPTSRNRSSNSSSPQRSRNNGSSSRSDRSRSR